MRTAKKYKEYYKIRNALPTECNIRLKFNTNQITHTRRASGWFETFRWRIVQKVPDKYRIIMRTANDLEFVKLEPKNATGVFLKKIIKCNYSIYCKRELQCETGRSTLAMLVERYVPSECAENCVTKSVRYSTCSISIASLECQGGTQTEILASFWLEDDVRVSVCPPNKWIASQSAENSK